MKTLLDCINVPHGRAELANANIVCGVFPRTPATDNASCQNIEYQASPLAHIEDGGFHLHYRPYIL